MAHLRFNPLTSFDYIRPVVVPPTPYSLCFRSFLEPLPESLFPMSIMSALRPFSRAVENGSFVREAVVHVVWDAFEPDQIDQMTAVSRMQMLRRASQRAAKKPLLEKRRRYSAGLRPVIFLNSRRNARESEYPTASEIASTLWPSISRNCLASSTLSDCK